MVWGRKLEPLSDHEVDFYTENWNRIQKEFPGDGMEAIIEFDIFAGPDISRRFSQHQHRLALKETERTNIERSTPHLPSDFVKRINEANYLDGASMMSLLEYLDFHSFAPLQLGHDGLYRFLLTPCTGALIPREFEQSTKHPLSDEVDEKLYEIAGLDPEIPSLILGINMSESRCDRQRLNKEANAPTSMDERSKSQLDIFVQLGVIGCCKLDQGNNNQGIRNTEWLLVVDVSTGRGGGVFIIFNTRPRIEDSERAHWGNPGDTPDLGPDGYRPDKQPGSGSFVGFIADQLTEGFFDTSNEFYPQAICTSQPELTSVRQKKNRFGLYKDPDTPAPSQSAPC